MSAERAHGRMLRKSVVDSASAVREKVSLAVRESRSLGVSYRDHFGPKTVQFLKSFYPLIFFIKNHFLSLPVHKCIHRVSIDDFVVVVITVAGRNWVLSGLFYTRNCLELVLWAECRPEREADHALRFPRSNAAGDPVVRHTESPRRFLGSILGCRRSFLKCF